MLHEAVTDYSLAPLIVRDVERKSLGVAVFGEVWGNQQVSAIVLPPNLCDRWCVLCDPAWNLPSLVHKYVLHRGFNNIYGCIGVRAIAIWTSTTDMNVLSVKWFLKKKKKNFQRLTVWSFVLHRSTSFLMKALFVLTFKLTGEVGI